MPRWNAGSACGRAWSCSAWTTSKRSAASRRSTSRRTAGRVWRAIESGAPPERSQAASGDRGAAGTSAGVQKVLDSTVPAGTYDKIKFQIHRLQAADNVAGAADLVAKNASILVDGTFNGTAFQFATSLEAEQELEGKFVIDSTSQNITLNFDPSQWFVSGTTVLDPSDAANKLAIEANIKSSLAAFQDDDESGHENHHGDDDGADDDAGDDHGGGGGGGHH